MDELEENAEFARLFRCQWLLARASGWCQIVAIVGNQSLESTDPEFLRYHNETYAPLVAVSALWHLQRCLANLEALNFQFENELKRRVDSIMSALAHAEISDARDALEHMEDRVADVNMERFKNKRHHTPYGDLVPEISIELGWIETVTILGKTHRVIEAIAQAYQIEKYLFQAAGKLHDHIGQEIQALQKDQPDFEG